MKIGRLVLALIGLAALAVAYLTGSLVFLAVAVIAFVAGLYIMGANKRPREDGQQEGDRRKGSRNR